MLSAFAELADELWTVIRSMLRAYTMCTEYWAALRTREIQFAVFELFRRYVCGRNGRNDFSRNSSWLNLGRMNIKRWTLGSRLSFSRLRFNRLDFLMNRQRLLWLWKFRTAIGLSLLLLCRVNDQRIKHFGTELIKDLLRGLPYCCLVLFDACQDAARRADNGIHSVADHFHPLPRLFDGGQGSMVLFLDCTNNAPEVLLHPFPPESCAEVDGVIKLLATGHLLEAGGIDLPILIHHLEGDNTGRLDRRWDCR